MEELKGWEKGSPHRAVGSLLAGDPHFAAHTALISPATFAESWQKSEESDLSAVTHLPATSGSLNYPDRLPRRTHTHTHLVAGKVAA